MNTQSEKEVSRDEEKRQETQGPHVLTEHQQISYCCAYWDWLRGLRPTRPHGHEWGLDDADAKGLRYQCDTEFSRQHGQWNLKLKEQGA